MTALTIEHQSQGQIAILSLAGYVDADTAPLLFSQLEELRESGTRTVIVDCSGVTYLSSHGIWTLVKQIILIRDKGGDIRLAAISPEIEMILHDLNMQTFFQYFDTVEEAAASFQ